ncbi:hypothetical protein ACFWPV_36655 [Streptomyces uncialis]|uniref:hypothetical protein n=1 Tax=Streptomyces uncialis TaxID=1048205 RepID=UPI00364B52F3
MRLTAQRLAATAAAGTLALVGVVALPGSASAAAAKKCTATQTKELDTVGPNLDLKVELCVHRNASNQYWASVNVAWTDGGGGVCCGMEKVNVEVRLERNNGVLRDKTYNYAAAINLTGSGSQGHRTDYYSSSSAGGWTADGKVVHNIQNNGAGDGTWQLGGSPSI